VRRHDSHDLLAIKRGEWSLEKVKAESDELFGLARTAYVNSPLPNEPDRYRAERWLRWIITDALNGVVRQDWA